jgi:hypothetical protein
MKLCGLCVTSVIPAKYAALHSVVATCETPPPTPREACPSEMMPASM